MGDIKYEDSTEFKLVKMEPAVVINYQQYTLNLSTGKPAHSENGFVKVFKSTGKVEGCFSHPFSLNEFEYGALQAIEGGYSWSMKAENPEDF